MLSLVTPLQPIALVAAAEAPHALAISELRQRALVLSRFGGPENFEVVDSALPALGDGEVRVRILAASVQFTDTLLRRGKYPDLKQKPPLILGYDVLGEVIEVGAGVSSPKLGERVADLTVTGSYARYRTLQANQVVPVPAELDAAEAVALVLSWTTAYQLLHRVAQVRSGQRVLIHGAAGSVGRALVALGKLSGLQIWGSARARDSELVRAAGATPIDAATDDAHTLTPEGFDVVFDGIGERGFAQSWASVGPGGMLVAFGFSDAAAKGTSSLILGWWLLRLYLWNLVGFSWWSKRRSASFYSITALRKRHPDWYRTDLSALFKLLQEHRIFPAIAERIGFDGVAEAHRQLEAGGVPGKLVLCPTQ